MVTSAGIELLGWTLIHSIWTIGVITAASAFVLRTLQRHSSHLRYVMGGLGLAMSAASVPLAGVAVFINEPRPLSTTPANQNSAETRQSVVDSSVDSQLQRVIPRTAAEIPAVSSSDFPIALPSASEDRSARTRSSLPTTDLGLWVSSILQPYLAQLVFIWLVGVCGMSLRPLIGWRTATQLQHVGCSPVPGWMLLALNQLAGRFGIRRPVGLFESSLISIPSVVGVLRPIILLPASAISGLTPDQCEAVLAHELAHVRRYDYFVNLLQTLVETVLFYHPGIWWLSRQVRVEREHCCDDLAVKVLNDPSGYCVALMAVETLRQTHQAPLLALRANDGSLLSRIQRLARDPNHSDTSFFPRWPMAFLACTALGAVGLTTTCWPVTADDVKANPDLSDAPVKVFIQEASETESFSPVPSRAERSVSRLVLVFFRDEARRAVSGLLIRAGKSILVVTASPATIVPDGVAPAIDRTHVEIEGQLPIPATYDDRSTTELQIYRIGEELSKNLLERSDEAASPFADRLIWDPTDIAELSTGDSLAAINPQTRFWTQPQAASVVSMDETITFTPPTLRRPLIYKGLIKIDQALPEGTMLFKEDKLAGIVLLGKRFGVQLGGSNTAYVVPSPRIAEFARALDPKQDDAKTSDAAGELKQQPASPVKDDLIARAIETTANRRLTLGAHSPWQLMQFFKAFGTEMQVYESLESKQEVSLWRHLQQGKLPGRYDEPIWMIRDGIAQAHPFTKIYEWEGVPGQFVAHLAAAGIPLRTELVAIDEGQNPQTITVDRLVDDLRRQKLERSQQTQWKLWALVQYSTSAEIWIDNPPQSNSIPLLIEQLLTESGQFTLYPDTIGLLGLAIAHSRFTELSPSQQASFGTFHRRVADKLDALRQRAQEFQGNDGWVIGHGPTQSSLDVHRRVQNAGIELAWLSWSLTPEELAKAEWLHRAARRLAEELTDPKVKLNEVAALADAVYGLKVFHRRLNGTIAVQIPERNGVERVETAVEVASSDKPDTKNNMIWRAFGRVTDTAGNPLSGVEVVANAGIGTLFQTGSCKTNDEGRYELRFGPGVQFAKSEDSHVQAATIQSRKAGYFEVNLGRQGNCVASDGPLSDEQSAEWKKRGTAIFFPQDSMEINFVMRPSGRVSGKLIAEDGKPISGYSISLAGSDLPPSSSVVATTKSDDQGRFELADLPTSFRYQFVIRKSDPKPPWDDSWASAAFQFDRPELEDLRAWFGEREIRLNELVIRIAGPGTQEKSAVPAIGNAGLLNLTSVDPTHVVENTKRRLVATSAVLTLSNIPGAQSSDSLIAESNPVTPARKSKTSLTRTRPDDQGQFEFKFENPQGIKLIPGQHQIIFQVFVGASKRPIREKIFRQLEIEPDGHYTVPVKIDPAFIDDSRVSLTFVSMQPQHETWVKDFFHFGKKTSYSGIWTQDGGPLSTIPWSRTGH